MTTQGHGGLESDMQSAQTETIFLGFCDLHGVWRGKHIPSSHLDPAERSGITLYGGVILVGHANQFFPTDLAPFHADVTSDLGDVCIKPIVQTMRSLPWNPTQSWCIADTEASSPWSQLSPRSCLQRVEEHYRQHGLAPVAALEREFYLLRPEGEQWAPYDGDCPSTVYTQADSRYIDEMFQAARRMRLGAHAWSREFDAGQFEVNLDHGTALDAADRDTYFRHMVRAMARQRHLRATFLGRPFSDKAGSGCHVHFSLWKPGGRDNLFAISSEDNPPLSPPARNFLAGVLSHAPALLALLCPTVNAYRRLQPERQAPTAVNWGVDDRQALVRVPKADGPGGARLEIRAADGVANPYLILAGILWAGWDGMERKLEPPPETGAEAVPAEPLPHTLEESLNALERDSWLCERLGPLLVKVFCALKRREIEHFRFLVPQEEVEFYQLL